MPGNLATARDDAPPARPGTLRPRVAVVTSIPTPWRNPCFSELARRCDLRVMFGALAEPGRDWAFAPGDLDFPHEVLSSLALRRQRYRPDLGGVRAPVVTQLSPGVLKALRRFDPEVVVASSFGPSTMLAMAWARWHRRPFILWSDGTRHSEGGLHYLRLTQRSMLVRRAQGFWSAGALATELLVSYGRSPAQPVTEGMTGLDTRELRRAVAAMAPAREALRRRLGLAGTVFLFVGSVAEQKGVPQMARAFSEALGAGAPQVSLVVAGRGPLVEMLAQSLSGVGGLALRLPGLLPPEQLTELYVAADVFLMPTLSDNWSPAVLEAAVAGVPQIFSALNGGSRDLVEQGAAGVVIDPMEPARLTETIRAFATAPPARTDAAALERLAAYYAPEAFAARAMASFAGLVGNERTAS